MSGKSIRKRSVERHSGTQWGRVRQLDDADIDYSDIPSTTPEFWASGVVVHPPRKVPISLRMDEDVLTWFKSQGARYQTRINAVLRAYVERYTGRSRAVRESPASYTTALLADVESARERYEALENLPALISPRILEYAERRIRAGAEQLSALKLPVLFFFLVRSDPRELRRLDDFLGDLRQNHREREVRNLVDRLRSEEDYRQAVGALFEVEILHTLLDAAPAGSVSVYPRIGTTRSHADAAVRLGDQTVYLEGKLVSQNASLERIQDIGTESALGQPPPSEAELRALGVDSVRGGVVLAVGDPYGDALRVMGKLTEKPSQLHPEAPNVICLGLADFHPDIRTAEWAIEAVFSGSATIPRIVAQQIRDPRKIATLDQLIREAKREPRLTGVLVFDVKAGRAHPLKGLANPRPGTSSRLDGRDWDRLLALFGFPT